MDNSSSQTSQAEEPERHPPPWYEHGLSFSCTRCGNCCTGVPGYVWLSEGDLHSMATRLGMPVDGFTRQFVRLVDDRLSLVERTNGDCVFWDRAAGCTVYEVRPEQCRTWPFWPGHLRTENDWKALQRTCPGAGRGELHSLEEVEAAARRAAEVLRP